MPRPRIPLLAQISMAHFMSHSYILAIPALLPLLPDALGVSFVELGAAVSLFNVLSALFQAPMGFVVDRYGPRRILITGMAAGVAGFFFLAMVPTYAGLLIASVVLGAANAVYHPSDYAILSSSIRESVMGRAFSVHSFAGFCGSAATPGVLTGIAVFVSIPAAFAVMGFFGAVVLAMMLLARPEGRPGEPAGEGGQSCGRVKKGASGAAVSVFSMTVLMLTFLYVMLNLSTSSMERFSASALIQGYNVSLPLANTALTAYLVCSATGVLTGGVLADMTRRHGFVAATAYGIAAALTLYVSWGGLSAPVLVVMFALIGFLTGVIVPSRDMLVRAASPKGSEGKVFGIVSTGFNIGGTVGPFLCGYFLDYGMPSYVFRAAVAFMTVTVVLTLVQERRRAGRDG